MWLILAGGSALFAGLTAVLAKCGIRKTDSTLATAIRTIVVFIFSWLMASLNADLSSISTISSRTWFFLILSGLATGASWLCYFKALQKGDVNKVVPIDKSGTVLSMILAFILLHETFSALSGMAMILIGIGTFLMIDTKPGTAKSTKSKSWILFAFGSAVFAALTSILAKIGIENIHSDLGTAIRTTVVLIMAWMMVPVTGRQNQIRTVSKRELFFILVSGLATGASWMCYFRALQTGPASAVVPIDKCSLLVTVLFSRIVLKEKLSGKAFCGLVLIGSGTFLMTI